MMNRTSSRCFSITRRVGVLGMLALACEGSGGVAVASNVGNDGVTPARTDATDVVRRIVATLDAKARTEVVLPFDAPDRRRWRRGPAPRPGMAIKDMSGEQRGLVDQLLATVLSDSGLDAVQGIRKEQDLLARNEEGLGADYYWIALYGEPGEGRWAWRLGGHHVSIHVTYLGKEVASITPLFLGAETEGDPKDGWAGYERLRRRERVARQVAAGCEPGQWATARIEDETPANLILSEPESSSLGEPEKGIKLTDLAPQSRALVDDLVNEYLSVLQRSIARPLLTKFAENRERFRFAWAGTKGEGESHYYRIQGPGMLIEYVNYGAHLHTILRTDADFGRTASVP